MKLPPFERILHEEDFAENTVETYSYAVKDFLSRYGTLDRAGLSAYKSFLIEQFKPRTVNVRILSLNKYLDATGKARFKLKTVKMPKESFLDQTLTNEDYLKFKRLLHKEPDQRWYFVVWFLAATGARISELVHSRVKHVLEEYIDTF